MAHRVEAAAADQEVEIRLHQLVAINNAASFNTGECDVAAARFRFQNLHSRAHFGDFHQAADDGRRGREEIELVLGDFDLAGEDDLVDAREGVVIEEVGLGFAVPLAAGCLKNLVGALVHVAVQLLVNLQGIAVHLGSAQDGQNIGSYLHHFFLMKGLQEVCCLQEEFCRSTITDSDLIGTSETKQRQGLRVHKGPCFPLEFPVVDRLAQLVDTHAVADALPLLIGPKGQQ